MHCLFLNVVTIPVIIFVFLPCVAHGEKDEYVFSLPDNLFAPDDELVYILPNPKSTKSESIAEVAEAEPITENVKHRVEEPKRVVFLPDTLAELALQESRIYRSMSDYADKLHERLQDVLSYLEDYEQSSKLFEDEYGFIGTHPLLAHRMIRRFVKPLSKVIENIDSDDDNAEQNDIYTIARNIKKTPRLVDFNKSMSSILRIQHYYNMEPKDIANGKLGDLDIPYNFLNARHCYEIGNHALSKPQFTSGIEWLEEALNKIILNRDVSIGTESVKQSLRNAIEMHDASFIEHVASFQENATTFMYSSKISSLDDLPSKPRTSQYEIRQRNATRFWSSTDANDEWAVDYNFKTLCSGQSFKTLKDKASLYCWYDKPHPYWYIQPLEKELLHEDPPLVQIYGVVGEKSIKRIQSSVSLSRSQIIDNNNVSRSSTGGYRTSYNGWMDTKDPKDAAFLYWLAQKIEIITGLTVINSSELLQVASYGYGHHYIAHTDALNDVREDYDTGEERLSTFMLYLSDVEVGGHTAFPYFGIAAFPVRGSAIFWNNLHKNGTLDKRTMHGACPVIYGHKWVANMWIQMAGNMLKRPCSLNVNE